MNTTLAAGRKTRRPGARYTNNQALHKKAAALADGLAKFPEYPPRDDMMNPTYLHKPAHMAALEWHFGLRDDAIVLGEVPIAWAVPMGREGVRIPDLMVAFDINHAHILAQRGYAISEQGKPPDFVLEVASNTTARNDETRKWRDYANFGVTEYWLYDPDWGLRYATGLSGWTLVDGTYQAIPIIQHADGMHYGDSAVLGLQVCWEGGHLRWYDPAEARYLDTYVSLAISRDIVARERNAVVIERNVAVIERDTAVIERDAAVNDLDMAARERDAAIAETQRLRDEIARLRAGRE